MAKKTIYQDTFLISGIMCSGYCLPTVETCFATSFQQQKDLFKTAQLIIDAEPQGLGLHRVKVLIECEDNLSDEIYHDADELRASFKDALLAKDYMVIEDETEPLEKDASHWSNILINLISLAGMTALFFTCPPSLGLTIGLTTWSFLTTAFTARAYLMPFIKDILYANPLATMNTTISLGWLLSLAHTLYHVAMMPLVSSFSMVWMSFLMPVVLIAVVNGMDEIKYWISQQSRKMQICGLKTLFPQMAETYWSYEPLAEEGDENLLLPGHDAFVRRDKSKLQQGMLIKVAAGECFPVDCMLIEGETWVDSSLLTGEPAQAKYHGNSIPAGAINLSKDAIVKALKNPYKSTVNQLLFRANRAKTPLTTEPSYAFTYGYSALIITGVIASVALPWALGVLTLPLLLNNVTGILFAVCPCTIAIAHQLPSLLSLYQRRQKGIHLREEGLSVFFEEPHTIVFDKTGTLTTGNSQVESCQGISESLWKKIYLLEKAYGHEHPLAKAIVHHCESHQIQPGLIQDLSGLSRDIQHRGLSAQVQGRTIHLGNADYLKDTGIVIPPHMLHEIPCGLTPVYVAEDMKYQGVIYIKHEMQEGMRANLLRLKAAGKKLIMLTGDSELSARGFNEQQGMLFDVANIHAKQTPKNKEDFLNDLMISEPNCQGVWFVGDGLNDAPCARKISEKGGVSCAIRASDKTAFFSDISLNGALAYLFEHQKINQFLKKIVWQNQALLVYGSLMFIAFILSFSVIGIAVATLIPLLTMVSTTLMVLFNAYRVNWALDVALDKNTAWFKTWMASDVSLGLLVGASFLLVSSLLITTLVTGQWMFPVLLLTGGPWLVVSSICLITAGLLGALFIGLAIGMVFEESVVLEPVEEIEHSPPHAAANEWLDSNVDNHCVEPFALGFGARHRSSTKDCIMMPAEHGASVQWSH